MDFSISYYYNRGAAPGVWPALTPDLSKHHIISYPHMFALGVIYVTWLRENSGKEHAQYGQACQTLLVFLQSRGFAVDQAYLEQLLQNTLQGESGRYRLLNESGSHQSAGQLQSFLNQFSWMDSNLFIGPSGAFRCDDPSQKIDKLPLSLPESQKKMIRQLITLKKEYLPSVIPNQSGTRGTITCPQKGAEELVFQLEQLLGASARGIYESKVSDWGAVRDVPTKRAPIVYPFHDVRSISQSETGRQARFQYLLLEDKTQLSLEQSVAVLVKSKVCDKRTCTGAVRGPTRDQQDENFSTYIARVPIG